MRYIFILLFLFTSLEAKAKLEEVSLQLLWLHQFQFAGYYMAKEKGFYKEAGFDVELKEHYYGVDIKSDVLSSKATFGVGRPDLIRFDSEGKKIILLAAIFQSTPNVLITLQSSNINSIKDFRGKTMMQTNDLVQSASINAMLKSNGVDISEVKILEHNANLDDLINGRVDIYSGYISNEPYQLKERGIKYKLFSAKSEGFDLYGDVLFTSKKYLLEHPEEVRKFREASLKGWKYAFSHIDESVDVIYNKYNTQKKTKKALLFEAKELKKLAYHKAKSLGSINEAEVQRIYDLYSILGVLKKPLDMQELLFDSDKVYFTKEEREYLTTKSVIRFCTQPDSMPYSIIKGSKFSGIGADLLKLVSQKADLNFELVKTQTWDESLYNIKARKCDILPMAAKNAARSKYINFTYPYYNESLVFVTRDDENYIIDIKTILDKKFAVTKGNSFFEFLKREYPNINLVELDSIEDGFLGVENGKYFAYIDVLMSAAYKLQHYSKLHLKMNGQLEKQIEVSFAVRSDDTTLFHILNKVAKSLTLEELQTILNQWVSINYTKGVAYWYYREIAFFVAFFIVFMLYREYFLKKKNFELEDLKEKLVQLNIQLETKAFEVTRDLESAQEIAKLGSWIMDFKNDKLKWSKETYRIFDIPEDSSKNLNESFLNRVHPEDREHLLKTYEHSLKTKQLYNLKHRILMDNGEVKYLSVHAVTKFSPSGEPLLTQGTVQDITDRVLYEEEMKKKDIYIMHQGRLAQMGEMLSMIAHQWKQPLSAIASTQITLKTTIELEKYDLSNEKERAEFLVFMDERLDKIALYVQSLSQTIKNFSNFYKPTKESEFAKVDSVIKKAYELVSDMMHDNNIEVSFDLTSNKSINIYENEFIQVILNLLTNAKDQLLEKRVQNPHISIKSYVNAQEIVIEIEDNAGGIESEILDMIFDPYFSTKLEKNGTGLGLYMSQMIIHEYHHGKLSVHNTEDGALFSIKLEIRDENEI